MKPKFKIIRNSNGECITIEKRVNKIKLILLITFILILLSGCATTHNSKYYSKGCKTLSGCKKSIAGNYAKYGSSNW